MLVKPDVVSSRSATSSMTRRGFLQAIGLAFVCRLGPLATGFTAMADDLVWLMRWCCFGSGLRYAGAG